MANTLPHFLLVRASIRSHIVAFSCVCASALCITPPHVSAGFVILPFHPAPSLSCCCLCYFDLLDLRTVIAVAIYFLLHYFPCVCMCASDSARAQAQVSLCVSVLLLMVMMAPCAVSVFVHTPNICIMINSSSVSSSSSARERTDNRHIFVRPHIYVS